MGLHVDIKKKVPQFSLDVAFDLDQDHEILALLGASGCGKSMTLKCIAGVITPDEGEIILNGRILYSSEKGINLPPQERHIGYLFQQYALFPKMNVIQNVMCAILEGGKQERRAEAQEALRVMHVDDLADKMPHELSGGQQQRVAMARIFASSPDIILLDEPLSALDSFLRWQLELELMEQLKRFPGAIFVSHNRDEVAHICQNVVIIHKGNSQPKIKVDTMFDNPGTYGAAVISGCKNFSDARVIDSETLECDQWGVELKTSCPISDNVSRVGLRAHHFSAHGNVNPIACKVKQVIPAPFTTIIILTTSAGGELRWECDKKYWESLDNPTDIVLYIDPAHVMPLEVSRER